MYLYFADRGQIELTITVFRSTTDPAKFHPDRSTYWRMAPKNMFSVYNRGRPFL